MCALFSPEILEAVAVKGLIKLFLWWYTYCEVLRANQHFFQKDLLQPLSKQEVSYWILRVTSQQSANLKILLLCLKLQTSTLLVCSKLCKFQNSSFMVKSLQISTLLVCLKVCKFQDSSCMVKSLQISKLFLYGQKSANFKTLLVWSKVCKFQLFLYGQKSANFKTLLVWSKACKFQNSSCMFKSLQISKLLLVRSKVCKFQNSSCMVKSLQISTLLFVWSKVCKFQNSSCMVKSLQISKLFLYVWNSANFKTCLVCSTHKGVKQCSR